MNPPTALLAQDATTQEHSADRRDRWHGGQLLAFSGLDGPTDYALGLVARTTFDQPGIDVKLPADARLYAALPATRYTIGSDHIAFESDTASLRLIFVDAWHILCHGPVQVSAPSSDFRVAVAGGRTLIGVTDHFDSSWLQADFDGVWTQRRAWVAKQLDRLAATDTDSPRHQTMAHALRLMKGQVCSGEGIIHRRWTTPDRWPHRGMWLWDTAFHAIGWRHVDPALAREMIDAVFDCQAADGFLPHFMTPAGGSDITQPPVLALAARMVQDHAPDPDWLATLYPKLAGYVRWSLDHRDRDGDGLVEWFIEPDPNCRSGESGMDNSCRFDSATNLGATDFNSYLALECELLADMARELGLDADAQAWTAELERLRALIHQRLYSHDTGFFMDIDAATGRHSPVLASAGFMPLICGAADADQVQSLLRHLDDPDTFGSAAPVPSIAANQPDVSTDMWRGPMWVCMNWLIAYGLDRYGLQDRARDLRAATTTEIERWHQQFGVFFEYYDAHGQTPPPRLMRKGKCPPVDDLDPFPHQVIHDFGWTATLYLDMVQTEQG